MKIYCSGIGGIGLSAYAAYQTSCGDGVLGSDRSASVVTDDLQKQGIDVLFNQDGSGIPEDIDLFVYSEAIPRNAPERMRAEELGVRQVSYCAALGELSKDHRVIAVCGTHGKSSTTAMAARVLIEAGFDPSVIVGTRLHELDGRNWRKGESNLFLVEACEYRTSFLSLYPNIILLTAADSDHLDYFGTDEAYQKAYRDFVDLLPEDGVVITHQNDATCQTVLSSFHGSVINADMHELPELQTPGVHMQQNAQLVLALASVLEIDLNQVQTSLRGYTGCWRRFERKGDWNGIPVIDDYGHHPKEVKATIQATKAEYPDRRIVCVFQPHMHHRTLALYKDFLNAFTGADLLIVPNVYNARSDVESKEVDVHQLVLDIQHTSGIDARNGQSLEHTRDMLTNDVLQQGDVLLCMGAGDITNLASLMVE